LSAADLIIAADGGAIHLKEISVNPDLIIGDLDSIDVASKKFFTARDIHVQTYPRKKDMTDTELCLEYAVSQGADEVVLMGCTGHRLDHTLANVLMLRRLLGMGVKGRILDAKRDYSGGFRYDRERKAGRVALRHTGHGAGHRPDAGRAGISAHGENP
jgi:thiamine pyrophosphokinase